PIAVQRLQNLVHPVPQERLDRLRVALDPVEIAVAVLQRAFLVAAETGVGVDRHALDLEAVEVYHARGRRGRGRGAPHISVKWLVTVKIVCRSPQLLSDRRASGS